MPTNQNKGLFIILTNQNKVLCIKINQVSENSLLMRVLGTAVKINIFSKIWLTKKIGNNINVHMKEMS